MVRIARESVNSNIVIISAGAIASWTLLKNGIYWEVVWRGLSLHPGIQVIGNFDYGIRRNRIIAGYNFALVIGSLVSNV